MSNTVHAIVKHRLLGLNGTAKGVALYLADLASDDGSGIWASKATMAMQLETSRNTVLRAIKALIEAGFLVEDGTKKCVSGVTICYALNVDLIRSMPCTCGGKGCNFCTGSKSEPLPNWQGGGAKSEPHGVPNLHPNHPLTIHEPSITPCRPPEADLLGEPMEEVPKKKRATELPDGWVPSEKNLADAWAANFNEREIEHEAEQFRDHHLARGTKFKCWDAAWRTWLRNARKFGGPAPRGSAGSRAHENLISGFARAVGQFE